MRAFTTLFIAACSLSVAWSAAITIPFNESSHNPTLPSGVAAFQTGALVLCEAFDATAPVCSGNNVSDLVVFGRNTAGSPTITYFSELSPGQLPGPGAEIGVPTPLPDTSTRFVLETVNEGGTELITYSPTANDPGGALVTGDSYIYLITSDVAGSDVPEPAVLSLLGVGLLGFGIRRFRRKDNR